MIQHGLIVQFLYGLVGIGAGVVATNVAVPVLLSIALLVVACASIYSIWREQNHMDHQEKIKHTLFELLLTGAPILGFWLHVAVIMGAAVTASFVFPVLISIGYACLAFKKLHDIVKGIMDYSAGGNSQSPEFIFAKIVLPSFGFAFLVVAIVVPLLITFGVIGPALAPLAVAALLAYVATEIWTYAQHLWNVSKSTEPGTSFDQKVLATLASLRDTLIAIKDGIEKRPIRVFEDLLVLTALSTGIAGMAAVFAAPAAAPFLVVAFFLTSFVSLIYAQAADMGREKNDPLPFEDVGFAWDWFQGKCRAGCNSLRSLLSTEQPQECVDSEGIEREPLLEGGSRSDRTNNDILPPTELAPPPARTSVVSSGSNPATTVHQGQSQVFGAEENSGSRSRSVSCPLLKNKTVKQKQ